MMDSWGLLELYNVVGSGIAQMLLGFWFFARLLHRKVRIWGYLLFSLCGLAMLQLVLAGRVAQLGAFLLLLAASGIFICRGNWKSAILHAALVVVVMQLCYGIMDSLLSALYPLAESLDPKRVGPAFMAVGELASLLLSAACCYAIYRCFFYYETIEKQYVFLVLIPVLLIFIMEEYINSVLFMMQVEVEGSFIPIINPFEMLSMQLLGMASLFCILFAYKKLLQNFRLSTEVSLLEQQEHSLNQYVEEAKAHYEKTKSFRHDIRNHITVVKELLQSGKTEQAMEYIGDLDEMTAELSFLCSTNNPVVDILVGKKLGLAESMGIRVDCTLLLPGSCGLRDIDICIILSNALDNAIHACRKMGGGAERYIRVSGRIQGDFLLIEMENSFHMENRFYAGNGSHVRNSSRVGNGSYVGNSTHVGNGTHMGNSSRVGNGTHMGNSTHVENGSHMGNSIHVGNGSRGEESFRQGTGLSNIKAVAEKYHGAISIKAGNGVFVLNVLLIIPQQ
ncbi:MAG: GHKL domain-containing protein [Lachnospiraceae bacterium]|jgi:sensor histidine kinase YesM|nr:GHKL domain-containing protein [Lachnospiraceae bacterium]